jgi:hypothetical protein
MHDLVIARQLITIREVAEEQGTSFGSCKGNLTKDLSREVCLTAADSRA